MHPSMVKTLAQLDNAFYKALSSSFSASRQHPWDGWKRVADKVASPPESVLDVACGNLRFQEFLDSRYGAAARAYYAVDSCPDLLPDCAAASFQRIDIVDELLEGSFLKRLQAPACDLVVCFGFMHHVPSEALRAELLRALLQKTRPGGLAAVSFWQFASDDRAREKALASTRQGCRELGVKLDEGDYLLGWNDLPHVFRYCHSFEEAELDALAASVAGEATLVDRFSADGRTGAMNAYLVFSR